MNGILYLYPKQHSLAKVDLIPQLVTCLRDLKIIAEPLGDKFSAWFIGDYFMRHIVFMGCAPYLKIEPESEQDQDFCHIRIKTMPQPILLLGENSRPPKCPYCTKSNPQILKQYQSKTPPLIVKELIYICEHCHASAPLNNYAWQRNAGIGQFFIEIPHIFPKEAIPSDTLLNILKEKTALDWDYFYLQNRLLIKE